MFSSPAIRFHFFAREPLVFQPFFGSTLGFFLLTKRSRGFCCFFGLAFLFGICGTRCFDCLRGPQFSLHPGKGQEVLFGLFLFAALFLGLCQVLGLCLKCGHALGLCLGGSLPVSLCFFEG